MDGLKGLPEAIEAVFPQTQVQLCIIHLVRHALSFVSYRDRKAVADDLKAVFKLLYLALRNMSKRWTMPIPNWSAALNQFVILFEGRVPMGGIGANPLTQNQT